MKKFTVTVIDTTGKQKYIFNTNRLRENIGASFLLSQSTKEWIEDILEKDLGVPKNRQLESIETSDLKAEVIYAAGGNALILFKLRSDAVQFTKLLSKRVLLQAPGVNLLVAHSNFDWDNDSLYTTVENLKSTEIEVQKYEQTPSVPLLSLSVTANCNSTQLPAVDVSEKYIEYGEDEEVDSYLISTETREKLKAVRKANQRLQKELEVDENSYRFPYRIDNLGRTEEESSYVAVVHIDGNNMGNRFKECGQGKGNRDYINDIRQLSQRIEEAGIESLKVVTQFLIESVKEGKIVGTLGEFELKKFSEESEILFLPFRPLVYAGDDITFICDGRLGLELAGLFLETWEKQTIKISDNQPLTACAGVSIVKTHYPFARAYKISEDLCQQAKRFVRKEREEQGKDYFSAIDWHLGVSGLLGSISTIRQREYQVVNNNKTWNLVMRPLSLNQEDEWRTWLGLTQVVKEFKIGENWRERKNKVIALREVLRQGSIEAVEEFLLTYQLPSLPLFPESSGQNEQLSKQGWKDRICGYFDAIEAIEFYLGIRG